MKTFSVSVLAATFALAISACEKKPQVTEKPSPATMNIETTRLGAAVDGYIQNPSTTQSADVDRAFAELDGEIAELDQLQAKSTGEARTEAQTKADNLRNYRDKERLRYTEAQVRAKAQAANDGAKDAGNKVNEAAEKAGDGVKNAAEAVKDGVENAVDSVKEKLD